MVIRHSDPSSDPGATRSTAAPVEEISASAKSLWETLLDALPQLGVALVIVLVGWALGRAVRWMMRTRLQRSRTPSFANVISKLMSWLVVLISSLVALAVTFPSVKPVDLLAGLGFFSVAVGFAFQDILENTLAGVLLLPTSSPSKRPLALRAAIHGGATLTPAGNLRSDRSNGDEAL